MTTTLTWEISGVGTVLVRVPGGLTDAERALAAECTDSTTALTDGQPGRPTAERVRHTLRVVVALRTPAAAVRP